MSSFIELMPVFTAIIAGCSSVAILGTIIKLFLMPIEKDIKILQKGQTELKDEIKDINKKLDIILLNKNQSLR